MHLRGPTRRARARDALPTPPTAPASPASLVAPAAAPSLSPASGAVVVAPAARPRQGALARATSPGQPSPWRAPGAPRRIAMVPRSATPPRPMPRAPPTPPATLARALAPCTWRASGAPGRAWARSAALPGRSRRRPAHCFLHRNLGGRRDRERRTRRGPRAWRAPHAALTARPPPPLPDPAVAPSGSRRRSLLPLDRLSRYGSSAGPPPPHIFANLVPRTGALNTAFLAPVAADFKHSPASPPGEIPDGPPTTDLSRRPPDRQVDAPVVPKRNLRRAGNPVERQLSGDPRATATPSRAADQKPRCPVGRRSALPGAPRFRSEHLPRLPPPRGPLLVRRHGRLTRHSTKFVATGMARAQTDLVTAPAKLQSGTSRRCRISADLRELLSSGSHVLPPPRRATAPLGANCSSWLSAQTL